jgi:hypothetical protein
VNPRLNPRGHAFHQHTDFKRTDRHRCRRLREKAGVPDDSFRNEFCNDCDHDDVVIVEHLVQFDADLERFPELARQRASEPGSAERDLDHRLHQSAHVLRQFQPAAVDQLQPDLVRSRAS